jgi:hypothetical protein
MPPRQRIKIEEKERDKNEYGGIPKPVQRREAVGDHQREPGAIKETA